MHVGSLVLASGWEDISVTARLLIYPLPITYAQHGTANVQVVLVANKCDVPREQWVVSEEDAEKFAEDHSLKLFYTSAKTGGNVEEAFLWLVQMIYDKYKDSK